MTGPRCLLCVARPGALCRRSLLAQGLPPLLLLLALSAAAPLAADCPISEPNHVSWPAQKPVWDFCWGPPGSGGRTADGDGTRISDVRYRGVTILKLGHIPILNVKYEPGSAHCGAPLYCYRDWLDQEWSFSCSPDVDGYCSGTETPATTVCDHPGTDAGGYSGVAVEDLGDRLRLTSQCAAGWYRYIPVWEFFPDGSIKASMDATAVDDACVAFTHAHHAYFRLDFDVASGANDDFVDGVQSDSSTVRVTTEQKFTDTSPNRSHWRIGSAGSPVTVDVLRNPEDGAAGDVSLVAGDFPVGDGWVLAYKASELSDNGGGLDCSAAIDPFVNGENVNGADIVLWVRGGALHEGEPQGPVNGSTHCVRYGPRIKANVPNQPPVATNDMYSSQAGARLSVSAPGVLANDLDADYDALTAALIAGPAHGALSLAADGSFTYTPATCFTGADTFQYSVSDGNGEASTGAAILNVLPGPAACFFTVAPCRILDTRATGQGPALASNTPRTATVVAACGVPPTATAVSLNVTAAQPTGPGNLALFPGAPPPGSPAALHFSGAQTRANNIVIALTPQGTLGLLAVVSGDGHVDAILDIHGYFQ